MPKLTVEYKKQAVPAFIARFKAETGYQEHDIKDKHGDLDDDGKELKDRDDERPQVVQLSQNDMTAEEAKQHWDKEEASGKKTDDLSEGKEQEEEIEEPWDGKFKFRKSTKRPSTELDFNVSKKKKSADRKKEKKEKKKGVKNKMLLSFGDDEEEEEEET
ncbi:uncharacterized protein KIAA1143 homolog [Bolinopsis microptera]|uniref:uncharacterized protein KIAA1143 homolog n=1 Tax=Bolinopsis microptera TaxID=2820187 RepID=UPI003079EE98